MTMNTTHNPTLPTTAAARLAIVALALVGILAGCSESIAVQQVDAATMDSGGVFDASVRADTGVDSATVDATAGDDDAGSPDANPSADAGVMPDAYVADVPEDAAYIRYERDLRPLLEASACADCHAGVGIVMDYAWISAPGETWCAGDFGYERRWNCFEEHARTQTTEMAGVQGCGSEFYHRHGEPCFEEEAQSRVLGWAADGYRE